MKVEEFINELKVYAAEVNFPFEVNQYDSAYFLRKHFRYRYEPFSNIAVRHSITILGSEPFICLLDASAYLPFKMDNDKVNEIARLMRKEYGLKVMYDDEEPSFMVGYVMNIEDLSREECLETELPDLFVRRIYMFLRLALYTYTNAEENGILLEESFYEAVDMEEDFLADSPDDIVCLHEYIKHIETRKFIERKLLCDSFYNNPDYFIEHYTGEKGKELSSFIYEVCSFFDFDNINGKDFIDIGYDVKVRKRDNYIHIIPPKVRDSGDYTDIFLSDKEKNPVFAYIEYNINSKKKKSYIACININNKSCMIAGVFRSHQKAIDFMKEKFSAA